MASEVVKYKWIVGIGGAICGGIITLLIYGLSTMAWADRNSLWEAVKQTNTAVLQTSTALRDLKDDVLRDTASKGDMKEINDKVQRVLDEQQTLRDATIVKPARPIIKDEPGK